MDMLLFGLVGSIVGGYFLYLAVKKSDKKKMQIFGVVTGIMVLYVILGISDMAESKTEINDKKVTYDELVDVIEEKEKEVSNIEAKLDELNAQYDEKDAELQEALKAIENKDQIQNEIDRLQSDLEKVESDLKSKKEELNSVIGKIKETGEKPVVLSAGHFTVGKDIKASRYKAVPNGGYGNFIVYNSNDRLKVNTILGNGDYAEPEFVFEASDGDKIELSMSVKFIPVE